MPRDDARDVQSCGVAIMASVGEKLYDAAGDGDHKLVDKLIKEDGTAVNWKRDNGETPLHAAAIANHEKVVDSLLKANADPNAKNDDGESPLHYAAMNDSGDAGCAKKLCRGRQAPSIPEAAAQAGVRRDESRRPAQGQPARALRPAGGDPGRRAGQRRRSLPRPPRPWTRACRPLRPARTAPPSARRRRRGRRRLELDSVRLRLL